MHHTQTIAFNGLCHVAIFLERNVKSCVPTLLLFTIKKNNKQFILVYLEEIWNYCVQLEFGFHPCLINYSAISLLFYFNLMGVFPLKTWFGYAVQAYLMKMWSAMHVTSQESWECAGNVLSVMNLTCAPCVTSVTAMTALIISTELKHQVPLCKHWYPFLSTETQFYIFDCDHPTQTSLSLSSLNSWPSHLCKLC